MITTLRMVLLMAFAGLALLVVIPIAQATTAVGNQNPQLTVRASATSEGADPDRATVGDTVTVAGSVKNNTAKKQTALVTVTARDPQGSSIYTNSENVSLRPGKTISSSYSYVVDESYQKGNYEITVSATNAKGTSNATATFEIY